MKLKKVIISLIMILKMLVRQKIVVVLLLIIPMVFLSIVELTASDRVLPFQLASLDKELFVHISEKGISFVFFAVVVILTILIFVKYIFSILITTGSAMRILIPLSVGSFTINKLLQI